MAGGPVIVGAAGVTRAVAVRLEVVPEMTAAVHLKSVQQTIRPESKSFTQTFPAVQ